MYDIITKIRANVEGHNRVYTLSSTRIYRTHVVSRSLAIVI